MHIDITHFYKPIRIRESYVAKNFPELLQQLTQYPENYAFGEKIYLYFHNMCQRPICIGCGKKETKYLGIRRGYQQYCCASCCATATCRLQKTEQTYLKRYGTIHYHNREKYNQTMMKRYGSTSYNNMEQHIQTCMERYGVPNAMQSPEVQQRAQQTCMERYGVRSPMQSPEVQQRAQQTCMERYGVPNAMQSSEVHNQMQQTCLERYGVEYYSQTQEYKNKSQQTCMERYGVPNAMQSPEVQQRAQQTCMERYGAPFLMQNENIASKNLQSRIELWKQKYNLLDIQNGVWICKCPHPECSKCNEKSYKISSSQYFARKKCKIEPCTNLFPIQTDYSTGDTLEAFVSQILDEYNISYQSNDRTILNPYELDFVIPDYHLAIECNGVFWHSTKNGKLPKFHLQKFEKCQEQGIQLLTFWEDQIKTKPAIVRSIILSKLGIYGRRIGARECTIRELKSATEFLESNHIQGRVNAQVKLGLYKEDELVGVMTFAKRSKLSGGQNDDCWELTRFCTLLNTQIIGGADKLLQYFIRNYRPSKIVSFASNDISNGSLYKRLGFDKDDHSTLAYWYISQNEFIRYHRSTFSKSRLAKMGYDTEHLTESQIMSTLPFYKIYDSGHTKYTLKMNIL